jgi:integrase
VRWYWCSWKAWKKYQPDFIINARQAGVSAATLNCYLRALNAYFRWAGLPVLPKLKQVEKVIATYGETDIEKILKAKCKGCGCHCDLIPYIFTITLNRQFFREP